MATIDERYDEAIQLQESGNLDEAVGKLEAIVADQADHALAHTALSVYYGKQEKHDKAVEHAEKVCELEPDDPFSHMAKSIVCQKAGKLPEAEQAMSVAMQKHMEANKPAEE